MAILYPFLAVVFFVVATAIEKRFLEKSRIPLGTFLIQSNLLLALFTLGVMAVVGERLASFNLEIWVVFAIFVILGVCKDFLYYRSFRGEPLSRVQFATLLEPIAVFALAALFFPEERDPRVWILGALAVGGLVFGHFRHHHFTFDAKERILLIFVVISAVKVMFAKFLLVDVSPMTLLFWECLAIALVQFMHFGLPWSALIPSHRTLRIAASSAAITAAALFVYGAYQILGVTITSLVLLLKPVLNYFVAHWYFGEGLDKKLLVGSGIILIAIIYAFLYVL